MHSPLRDTVDRWHAAVNDGSRVWAASVVSDPLVVLGRRGAAPITPQRFADWVERSGITLVPRAQFPVSDRLMVVEEEASWREQPGPSRVAALFRVHHGKVSAALRLPDLAQALELAYIYREMAASESTYGGARPRV